MVALLRSEIDAANQSLDELLSRYEDLQDVAKEVGSIVQCAKAANDAIGELPSPDDLSELADAVAACSVRD